MFLVLCYSQCYLYLKASPDYFSACGNYFYNFIIILFNSTFFTICFKCHNIRNSKISCQHSSVCCFAFLYAYNSFAMTSKFNVVIVEEPLFSFHSERFYLFVFFCSFNNLVVGKKAEFIFS